MTIFDEYVVGISRQHTRTRFRNHFGNGRLGFDARTFAKGTILAAKDKPVKNLLQESPDSVRVTRISGSEQERQVEKQTSPSDVLIGALLKDAEVEQGLIVDGHKAKLFVYFDPTAEELFVVRETHPEEEVVKSVHPSRRSR